MSTITITLTDIMPTEKDIADLTAKAIAEGKTAEEAQKAIYGGVNVRYHTTHPVNKKDVLMYAIGVDNGASPADAIGLMAYAQIKKWLEGFGGGITRATAVARDGQVYHNGADGGVAQEDVDRELAALRDSGQIEKL